MYRTRLGDRAALTTRTRPNVVASIGRGRGSFLLRKLTDSEVHHDLTEPAQECGDELLVTVAPSHPKHDVPAERRARTAARVSSARREQRREDAWRVIACVSYQKVMRFAKSLPLWYACAHSARQNYAGAAWAVTVAVGAAAGRVDR
jgi:hypothetical protein